jgi:glycosyltransferase involved in cell wall biosynthesis
MEYMISIIIPVYNVENYIERCAKSLFEQSIDDVEFIFIDDCSSDRSNEILKRVIDSYPSRQSSISVISNDINLGSSATRNLGLQLAKGRYIAFCDSDDWVDLDMYRALYDEVIKNDIDIIWCDYYNENSTYCNIIKQEFISKKNTLIKSLLSREMKWSLWNKIFRRGLFVDNNISFVDGANLGEDMSICIRLFAVSNTFKYMANPYYHYRVDNIGSITSRINDRSIFELLTNVDIVLRFFKNMYLEEEYFKELNWFKLINKSHILYNKSYDNYKRWNSIYPESNKYILSCPAFSSKKKVFLLIIDTESYFFIKIYSIMKGVYLSLLRNVGLK